MSTRRFSPEQFAALERQGIAELQRIREPLFRELEVLRRDPDYNRGLEPHRCCLRELNQMRISPLEAKAIARAFRTVRRLRWRLPAVLRRLRGVLPGLRDTTERQNFDCPLLDGTRCLVHDLAKPIGCAAWNPGDGYTSAGLRAFRQRDRLNERIYGPRWKSRVIPLWLERVLGDGSRR